MKSWASIVRTAPVPVTVTAAAPAAPPAQQQGDIFVLHPTKIRTKKNASGGSDCAAPEKQPQQKQLQEEETEETPQLTAEPIKPIERPHPQPQHDDDPNSFPAHVSLTRPGAPTVAPIFKNNEDMQEWQKNEHNENHKYSNQVHSEKVQEWRKRVNWHIVPSMTSITPEEKALGFIKVYKPYYQVDQETRFSTLNPTYPLPPDYGYLVPWNSTIRNIHPDFLALLFHNRADELCKCKTVEDFEKVYIEGAKLHWNPSYWQSQVQQFTPEAALWTMSTKANMWPGKTFAPRPDGDGCRGLSGSASALAHYGIKKTPKYEVHGVERGETGICNVKDLKTLGKKAPIRWYVSPAYLKNMKRFEFIFEENPNARTDYDSDDWFGDW
jgi:hypothetical protein